MAWKRTVIGSVLKSKEDPKESYIKISKDITLSAGDTLKLESKEDAMKNLKAAFANEKISEQLYTDLMSKAQNTPDFVRFNILKLENK